MTRYFELFDRVLVVVSVLALTIIMVVVTISVFGRYFFSVPIPDDLVFSEMLLVFVAFLPLSYVQARREHIFVTVFTEWMTNEHKVVLETAGLVIGAVTFSVVTAAVFNDFYAAWEFGAYGDGPLKLPEWPSKLVVVLGLGLFAFRLIIDAVICVVGLFTGTAYASKGEIQHMLDVTTSDQPADGRNVKRSP